MYEYCKEYKILASDVDMYQRLRPSRFFTFLQEAAIAHTEQLRYDRTKTLDRGFLWVVTLQEARINRMPLYDELVVLESCPGERMHAFYPRHYRLSLTTGEPLVVAEALWMLIDGQKRCLTFPQQTGVEIAGSVPAWETFMPVPPKIPENVSNEVYTVPYSQIDLNGHMNNAFYLDLAEDRVSFSLLKKHLRLIRAEYKGEAIYGQPMVLNYSTKENTFLMSGSHGQRLFRLMMQYDD